jgi:hypothetical protein
LAARCSALQGQYIRQRTDAHVLHGYAGRYIKAAKMTFFTRNMQHAVIDGRCLFEFCAEFSNEFGNEVVNEVANEVANEFARCAALPSALPERSW